MSLFGDEVIDDQEDDFSSVLDSAPQDSLLPPHQSSFFIGHEDVEKNLLNLWNSGRMPHALIFNGVKGIGKATLAYRLSRFILKESAENGAGGLFGDDVTLETMDVPTDHPVFSKVSSGGHLDMLTIARPFDEKTGQLKNDIPVDDIRKVAPFLRKTSGEGGWRIVIIDDANMMNRNGQNALLKILEEPPKNALLILVTHGAGGLLPTIRSRCHFVPFQTLEPAQIETLMRKAAETPIMPGDEALLLAMADGSAGQAITLLNEGGLEAANILLGALANLEEMNESQIDALALSYGKSGDKKIIEKFVFILNWWFETLIMMAVEGTATHTIGTIDLRLLLSILYPAMSGLKHPPPHQNSWCVLLIHSHPSQYGFYRHERRGEWQQPHHQLAVLAWLLLFSFEPVVSVE